MKKIGTVGRALIASSLSLGGAQVQAQSLYDEATFKALTADHKAFRVGDVLTVQVVENAMATANADTGTQRRNGLGVDRSNRLLNRWGRPCSVNATSATRLPNAQPT